MRVLRKITQAVVSPQEGLTLIEVMISSLLLATGISAALGVLDSANRAGSVAQRHQSAVEIAQRELERIADLNYSEISLTTAPGSSADEDSPLSRVSGTQFLTEGNQNEPLVIGGAGAAVSPGPQTVQEGSTSSQVYRFVTWVDAPDYVGCTQACDRTQDYKRITVAVRTAGGNAGGFSRYVMVSTLRVDPFLGPLGQVTQPPDPSPTQAHDNFYLYDTQNSDCSSSAYQQPTGDHQTHDTRGHCGSGSGDYPDLMGVELPPNPFDPDLPSLYTYSSDLTGDYTGGLALQRGSDCSLSGLTKYQVHSWSTGPVSDSTYRLTGRFSFDFWSALVGGTSGKGKVCVWLFDRLMEGGEPQDTLIANSSYTLENWPVESTNLSFTFSHDPYDLPAGHRLLFVLTTSSESVSDLQFVYDHPVSPSFIQIRTTTPITE